MDKFTLSYSEKNIPVPQDSTYMLNLIQRVHDFIKRLRWKAFFFLRKDDNKQNKETYGFKSNAKTPSVPELKPFENDLLQMIENVKFQKVNNNLQNQLRDDMKKIKAEKNLIVPADKTNNFYLVNKQTYENLLINTITKDYKKADQNAERDINLQAKTISENLDISDRMKVLAKKLAYVTLKDHKLNFRNNPTCRLINPSKSELGLISKQLLDKINTAVLSATGVNQWKNTSAVIKWFKEITVRKNTTFLSFDIANYYPSITKELLLKALTFAQKYITISHQDIDIIVKAKNSLLFHDETPWRKKATQDTFDVTMGSFDGAETCELVGAYILEQIQSIIPKEEVGLYRDDGLAVIHKTPRQTERTKKKLCEKFKELGLRITVAANQRIVDFLDITLNLEKKEYQPYTKPGNKHVYVHTDSNHPPVITKQIPKSIQARLSSICSNETVFKNAKAEYEEALKEAGHKEKLKYTPSQTDLDEQSNNKQQRKNRQRKILWFNPPYSAHVKSNIGNIFINLVQKHFPTNHPLRTICNKNNLKISYSCLPNMSTVIKSHNNAVMKKKSDNQQSKKCNCRTKTLCPLAGKCLTKNVVYEATVTTNDTTQKYIGMTSCAFKTRFDQHSASFRHKEKMNSTKLSSHIWKLKETNAQYKLTWKILKQAQPYSPNTNKCNLCNWEKYLIITSNKATRLNSKSELLAKCPHKLKHLLSDYG